MSRHVLIVGASRGLGLEFVRQYSHAGWNVIGTVRTNDAAQVLRKLQNTEAHVLDIREEKSFIDLADDLTRRNIQPSILIHNAGVNVGREATYRSSTFNDWNECLAVNVTGAVGTARFLVPLLPSNTHSRAVFITSELGSISHSNGGYLPYRASKAALNMLVRNLAIEEQARGIICVALHPGWVKTDMGGPAAPLDPHESIHLMRETIDRLEMKNNGTFLDLRGKVLPY